MIEAEQLRRHIDNAFYGLEVELERAAQEYIEDIIYELKENIARSYLPMHVPEFNKKAANDWEWVSRATGEECRYTLHFMHIKDGMLEATNGDILLRCPINNYEDGIYHKNGEKIEGCTYPDTSRIVPNFEATEPIIIEEENQEMTVINNGLVVNSKYLFMVTEGEHEKWRVGSISDKPSPVVFKHEESDRTGVIMSMRKQYVNGEFVRC